MPDLHGSRTHQNLMAAFARESQNSVRYLWFAQLADIDGQPDIAALFRSVADGEIGHAQAVLEHLVDLGDPVTGEPIGETDQNLRAAIAGEFDDAAESYPSFAAAARAEGHDAIAEWFDTLARAEDGQLDRLRAGLDALG